VDAPVLCGKVVLLPEVIAKVAKANIHGGQLAVGGMRSRVNALQRVQLREAAGWQGALGMHPKPSLYSLVASATLVAVHAKLCKDWLWDSSITKTL
jgi:hypothetical protein